MNKFFYIIYNIFNMLLKIFLFVIIKLYSIIMNLHEKQYPQSH